MRIEDHPDAAMYARDAQAYAVGRKLIPKTLNFANVLRPKRLRKTVRRQTRT